MEEGEVEKVESGVGVEDAFHWIAREVLRVDASRR